MGDVQFRLSPNKLYAYVLIYSLDDKKPAENPAAIHEETLILQKKEIVVQLLNSDPKKTTMK